MNPVLIMMFLFPLLLQPLDVALSEAVHDGDNKVGHHGQDKLFKDGTQDGTFTISTSSPQLFFLFG